MYTSGGMPYKLPCVCHPVVMNKYQLFRRRVKMLSSWHYFAVPLLAVFSMVCYMMFFENVPMDIFIDKSLQRPEVWIPHGKIQGVNMVSRSGRKLFGFQGIPFAQPPVGNLRFKPPLPATAWNDTLDASTDSKPCPQSDGETMSGNEDCLYVNVYTPRLPVTENPKLLPVMIYIYGGLYEKGTNDLTRFSPGFILDKDVVLVIPNHRIGILGYLSTGDEISPGNNGLKDLLLALEWNRDNIRYFGGDPDRVTLVGGSTGAMSVHLLTLSDLTKGLIHKYITQSGSALSVLAWRPTQTSVERAMQLGEYLGCPTNTSAALVDCFTGFDALQLVNASMTFHVWNGFPRIVWGPTIEPEIEGALLTDSPANLIAAGKVRDLPWLESMVRDEGVVLGVFFYDKPSVYQEFFNNLDTLLPIILQYDELVDNKKMITDALKSYYFADLNADMNLLLTNLTNLAGDYFARYPSYRAARQQLIHAKQPHYISTLEYRGTVSLSYMFSGGSTQNSGVCHGDELLYLFDGLESLFGPPGWKFNENDWKMVDIMVQLWTSFMINGTPSIGNLNSTVVWEPYSSQRNYLRIGNGSDTTLEVAYDLHSDRMRFWEELDAATSQHKIT